MKAGSVGHCDGNCYSTTRFLFEIDVPKDKEAGKTALNVRELRQWKKETLRLAKSLLAQGMINRITFSGNVSYHCILETSSPVPDYKSFWSHINGKYFNGKADSACSHPSRWTRTPGVVRKDTGKLQRSFGLHNRIFDPTIEFEEMARKKISVSTASKPLTKDEAFQKAVAISKTATPKHGRELKQQTQNLLNGVFPSDDFIDWAIPAINELPAMGYSKEEIRKLVKRAGPERYRKVKGFIENDRPLTS